LRKTERIARDLVTGATAIYLSTKILNALDMAGTVANISSVVIGAVVSAGRSVIRQIDVENMRRAFFSMDFNTTTQFLRVNVRTPGISLSSSLVTMNIYAHIDMTGKRDIAESLDKRLSNLGS